MSVLNIKYTLPFRMRENTVCVCGGGGGHMNVYSGGSKGRVYPQNLQYICSIK